MLVQLLRVKLLKSPPSWVRLNGEECRFDLAIGIQDDYGVDVDTFGLLEGRSASSGIILLPS